LVAFNTNVDESLVYVPPAVAKSAIGVLAIVVTVAVDATLTEASSSDV
jgi:hypothetical protein